MSPRFAVAVQWPDEKKLYLVHVQKPYFVAAAHIANGAVFFFASFTRAQLRAGGDGLGSLLRDASRFFASALGITIREAHFIKGDHGHEFPRFLMARTEDGASFIVEPEHPSPLVEVKDPAPASPAPKLSTRFDVVTQWRLAEMRKYYQQFIERQRPGQDLIPSSSILRYA